MAKTKTSSKKKIARPVLSVNHTSTKKKRKVATKKKNTVVPAPVPVVTKTHVFLVLDESGSMSRIADAADRAAQAWITGIKTASLANNQDTYANVVLFDDESRTIVMNTPIGRVDISSIKINRHGGSTALYATTIDVAQRALAAIGDRDSALVLIVTDGGENCRGDEAAVRRKIAELVATDRVDVALMVPPGHRQSVSASMGVSIENVREWEASAAGLQRVTRTYASSFNGYYANRSVGITSNRSVGQSFYVDPDDLKKVDMDKLTDISAEIRLLPITHRDPERIDEFFVTKLARPFEKGKLFYELTKSEELRPGRSIIVQDMTTGKVFGGDEARSVLGLSFSSKVRVRPGKDKKRRVFVQSTSLNRKLVIGTEIVLWERAAS